MSLAPRKCCVIRGCRCEQRQCTGLGVPWPFDSARHPSSCLLSLRWGPVRAWRGPTLPLSRSLGAPLLVGRNFCILDGGAAGGGGKGAPSPPARFQTDLLNGPALEDYSLNMGSAVGATRADAHPHFSCLWGWGPASGLLTPAMWSVLV